MSNEQFTPERIAKLREWLEAMSRREISPSYSFLESISETFEPYIAELEALQSELATARLNAKCPCCENGVTVEGLRCPECKGKGLAVIAYEHTRYENKKLTESLATAREEALEEAAKVCAKYGEEYKFEALTTMLLAEKIRNTRFFRGH